MKKNILEKISSPLTLVAAAGCPMCFPALAGLGSSLGLTFLAPYSGLFLKGFQVLVIISLISIWYSYKKHRRKTPLYLALVAAGLIFGSFYRIIPVYSMIYVGMGLLVIASFSNILSARCVSACDNPSK